MKFARVVLLILSVYLCGHLWFFVRNGFSLKRTVLEPPYPFRCSEHEEERVLPLLNQPFYYLGKGRQCYAFVSSDDRFVLKIPRFDRYNTPLILRAFDFGFLESKKRALQEDHEKRFSFLLESFSIASTDFSSGTKVVYSHLHRTRSLPQNLTLHDALHRPLRIDLNRTVFALQEKHPLLIPLFLKELKEGNREKAQELLTSLLNLFEKRARLGLFNKDAHFLRNYSWDGTQSVQIDIGSFFRDPLIEEDQVFARSFFDAAWPVREWLVALDPEMAQLIEHRIFIQSCAAFE